MKIRLAQALVNYQDDEDMVQAEAWMKIERSSKWR